MKRAAASCSQAPLMASPRPIAGADPASSAPTMSLRDVRMHGAREGTHALRPRTRGSTV